MFISRSTPLECETPNEESKGTLFWVLDKKDEYEMKGVTFIDFRLKTMSFE